MATKRSLSLGDETEQVKRVQMSSTTPVQQQHRFNMLAHAYQQAMTRAGVEPSELQPIRDAMRHHE